MPPQLVSEKHLQMRRREHQFLELDHSIHSEPFQFPDLEGMKPLILDFSNESADNDVASDTCTDDSRKSADVCTANNRGGKTWKLFVGTLGIYSAYLLHGHIQEDLFRYRAEDGTKFRAVWFLQVLEAIGGICVGWLGRRFWGGRSRPPIKSFLLTGASQVFAKAFTALALAAGLSFPVCVLAKSAKIVPVMLGQLALGGSTFETRDFVFSALVVGGTALLSIGDSSKTNTDVSENKNTMIGLLFILVSLLMDGVTGGLQERIKNIKPSLPPTTFDFLLFTNMSMGLVALTIATLTGDFGNGVSFLNLNPAVSKMLLRVCLCSAFGQAWIFFVVVTFDPVVCSTITTTRKMLSVLWSFAAKGHVLSGQSAVGLGLALGGLMLEVHNKMAWVDNRVSPKEKLSLLKSTA